MSSIAHDEAMAMRGAALDIVDLVAEGRDRYRAGGGASNPVGSIYGGRLIGQSLAAAMRTVEGMPATSLHAHFLAAGHVRLPVRYEVSRLRDSRRFATRQVTALQDGRLIFTLIAAFHDAEAGFEHQSITMPDVPPPEAVMPVQRYVRENEGSIDLSALHAFAGATPIELRPVAPDSYFKARGAPARSLWFRVPGAAGIEDLGLHLCLIAFASDYWLASVAAIPHAFPTNSPALLISSLDHALWFHRPARCDEWLLHHTTSPSAGDGLGLTQGRIFDRRGRLIATTAQECLLRRLGPTAD